MQRSVGAVNPQHWLAQKKSVDLKYNYQFNARYPQVLRNTIGSRPFQQLKTFVSRNWIEKKSFTTFFIAVNVRMIRNVYFFT